MFNIDTCSSNILELKITSSMRPNRSLLRNVNFWDKKLIMSHDSRVGAREILNNVKVQRGKYSNDNCMKLNG